MRYNQDMKKWLFVVALVGLAATHVILIRPHVTITNLSVLCFPAEKYEHAAGFGMYPFPPPFNETQRDEYDAAVARLEEKERRINEANHCRQIDKNSATILCNTFLAYCVGVIG